MKKLEKQLLKAFLGLVAMFVVIGIAGNYDWTEQVILHMSCDEYDWVNDTLTKKMGENPSDRDIALWWAEHHDEMK